MEPVIPGAKTGPPHKVMKSTFVGTVIPVTDENAARAIVKEIKAADRKARHVAFAFRIAGNPVREGMSDDGEPHGTGGMPILLLLRNGDITNILVTVTRYWGGIKLGPGNLKRAYRDAAKSALGF
ncbi:YigZ family protein [bacterium]|nr:YigZ family protein [bacterium]